MTLGQRVKALREQRQMNQEELAARANISQPLLSCIERGRTRNPGADALKGLARALHTTSDYLIGMYDEEPTTPDLATAVP